MRARSAGSPRSAMSEWCRTPGDKTPGALLRNDEPHLQHRTAATGTRLGNFLTHDNQTKSPRLARLPPDQTKALTWIRNCEAEKEKALLFTKILRPDSCWERPNLTDHMAGFETKNELSGKQKGRILHKCWEIIIVTKGRSQQTYVTPPEVEGFPESYDSAILEFESPRPFSFTLGAPQLPGVNAVKAGKGVTAT